MSSKSILKSINGSDKEKSWVYLCKQFWVKKKSKMDQKKKINLTETRSCLLQFSTGAARCQKRCVSESGGDTWRSRVEGEVKAAGVRVQMSHSRLPHYNKTRRLLKKKKKKQLESPETASWDIKSSTPTVPHPSRWPGGPPQVCVRARLCVCAWVSSTV